ncbi:MAG: metallophosphoesterase [Enterococcus sp.]
MKKLAIISDLHADINQFIEAEQRILADVLYEQSVTHLHFAGDTANTVERCLEVIEFFDHLGFQVTYNFGNHELADVHGEEAMNHFPEQHFLNEKYIQMNEGAVLLGLNGWYDYSFGEEKDFRKVEHTKNVYWYDRYIKRDASDPVIMERIIDCTQQLLDELEHRDYQVTIATHFVPKQEFIVYQKPPYERWNTLNAFLGSEKLGELIDSYTNVDHVVFGHTHRRFEEKRIHQTAYNCRPFGYYYEWQLTKRFVLENELVTQYNPMKLRKVLRENKDHFYLYRSKYLADEFRQGMTLLTY